MESTRPDGLTPGGNFVMQNHRENTPSTGDNMVASVISTVASKRANCSFCGRSGSEVRYMFSGRKGFICDDCATRASELIAQEASKPAASEPPDMFQMMLPQLASNPYPIYQMLRAADPVMRTPSPVGIWIVT